MGKKKKPECFCTKLDKQSFCLCNIRATTLLFSNSTLTAITSSPTAAQKARDYAGVSGEDGGVGQKIECFSKRRLHESSPPRSPLTTSLFAKTLFGISMRKHGYRRVFLFTLSGREVIEEVWLSPRQLSAVFVLPAASRTSLPASHSPQIPPHPALTCPSSHMPYLSARLMSAPSFGGMPCLHLP